MKAVPILRQNYPLAALLVLGAVLRLYHLDFQSVWLDEINTLNDANPAFSVSQVYASVAKYDLHPPLYFYVIWIFFKLFGYTAFVARLFSVVVGIAAILAIFRLGKELFNKNVGLVAAMLLCVNGYHIYYSQEARPYAMFCLFTICSFLFLVRFIKLPTRRNAVCYGVYTALMLYGHLFGLFTLVGQMAAILFFIAISRKEDRKAFLVNSMIAGLIAFVLFAPSAKIVYAALVVKEFWIPKPAPDAFIRIFSEFFSGSEMILLLVGILGIVYFISLYKEKNTRVNYESITGNKTIFGFIILSCWIVFTVLLPLVKSYFSFPIILGRYFINILPALLLIVSVGLWQLRHRLTVIGFAYLIFVFSLADLIAVRKYYTTVTKTQFRELTQYINTHNAGDEPVATSLAWHFNYFLNGNGNKHTVIDANLDKYVAEMAKDSTKIKAFWYVDAHDRPYNVTTETQRFLDRFYTVAHQFEKHDIWTRHYRLRHDDSITNTEKSNPAKK